MEESSYNHKEQVGNMPVMSDGILFPWQLDMEDRVRPSFKRGGENIKDRDFPGGPVVKNPLSSAGNTGSIPCRRFHMLQCNKACVPQLLKTIF